MMGQSALLLVRSTAVSTGSAPAAVEQQELLFDWREAGRRAGLTQDSDGGRRRAQTSRPEQELLTPLIGRSGSDLRVETKSRRANCEEILQQKMKQGAREAENSGRRREVDGKKQDGLLVLRDGTPRGNDSS